MRKHYQYNHNSCQRRKKCIWYLSIFLNEIRIWTVWLGQFLSPNLHRVQGHNVVLGNVTYNEEIPTSISVRRSQSNNNMEVSSPTHTSMGKYLLVNNVIHLFNFILFHSCFGSAHFSNRGPQLEVVSNFSLLETLVECLLGLWRSCSWCCAYLEADPYLHSQIWHKRTKPGSEGGRGKEALPGMIILKDMRWNTEFLFGQPSFRYGLIIVAGYLDAGGKVCHYTHTKKKNIYI